MRLLALLVSFALYAEPVLLQLTGNLTEQRLEEARGAIKGEEIVLEIDSLSGDLQGALRLAQELYSKKREGTKVTVYIRGDALGPAAVFPFVADEIWISPIVTWGDIPLASGFPVNRLRSRVQGLISRPEMAVLAEGMIDPEVSIVANGKWRAVKGEAEGRVISPAGETLVLNHHQMQELGLVDRVIAPTAFEAMFEKAEVLLPAPEPEGVDARLARYIQFDPEGENLVGHLMIGKEGIGQSTWIYVKSALDLYKKKKPIFIILELNSPGGEVFASQQISDALKDMDTDYGIPVVAFIDNWAISAGAMLAYSSRFIAISKDAAMGAAEPVLAGQQGPQTAGEKITSALRADFANRAAFFDRNPLIAEAMVDKEIILVRRGGEIVRLDTMEQVQATDKLISAEGKLLTLKATELLEYDVADFQVPPTAVAPLSAEEESAGEYPASRSLLFQYPFFEKIPNAKILAYRMDWKTKFFALLAHPMVASLLFLGLMLGFYIEMNTPGFGLPGSVALACLFLIVLSSFALQAVNWLEMILLLVGLVLIAVEVFVIPGFGVVGIIGIIMATVGLIALMLPGLRDIQWDFDTGHLNEAGRFVLERAAWLGGAIIVGVVLMVVLSRFVLPKFSHFNRLVLRGEQEGYIGTPDVSEMPDVGSEGVALSTLRPAGKVEIDGVVYDCVSTGVFVDPGTAVRIARYEGSRMVVEEIE